MSPSPDSRNCHPPGVHSLEQCVNFPREIGALPIGNAVFSILIILFMDNFEKQALRSLSKITLYKWYVDDTHIITTENVENTFSTLNNAHPAKAKAKRVLCKPWTLHRRTILLMCLIDWDAWEPAFGLRVQSRLHHWANGHLKIKMSPFCKGSILYYRKTKMSLDIYLFGSKWGSKWPLLDKFCAESWVLCMTQWVFTLNISTDIVKKVFCVSDMHWNPEWIVLMLQ